MVNTSTSTGLGQSVLSAQQKGCESNGNNLAMEISKLEGFVMGVENRNRIGNDTNTIVDVRRIADASASPPTSSSMPTMTAAALLWGRGPMTTAPLTTSTSSLQQASKAPEQKPKMNSPASNAAAALLVGMSMRKELEADTLQANIKAIQPTENNNHVSGEKVVKSESEDSEGVDVESKWREIRREISQHAQLTEVGDYEEQENGLELPKGVTRRPSGAWQAQIYFAGKTRYIGVWERPQQAAMAYNLAKEALKDLKAQRKGFRKRQRNHPGTKTDSMMATPHKNLPPSITWPSSASSSSSTSSGGFFSPNDSMGPFKKRKGSEPFPEAKATFETILPLPQQQQQGLEQASEPLARGHPYSAFSQHFNQQQLSGQSGNNPLTHPALQLLSLRPPQPANSLWMQPQPSQYHPQQQQFHHQPHALQQFPYSQANRANNTNNRTNQQYAKMQASANHSAAPTTKGAKKSTKNKRFKQSASKKSKSNKSSTNRSSDAKDKAERDAKNQKWKTIRAEVVALFDDHKKKNGGTNASKPTKTFDKDVLRGITVRPSGKFQAQLYFGGRSRYIGVFDSEFEAASAYEMIRSRLKDDSKKISSPPRSEAPLLVVAPSLASSVSMDTLVVKEFKDTGEDGTSTSSNSTMRSITPSPTPQNDVHSKANNKAITT
eukprot:CAMPEP_0116118154 /NCGR_PEP_ID=MMETSP0329-20121206/1954_1 /TAXON_ID=697910 /ORGANISM="Pseudo-nitzschia arenysensis, Strain B593" /LENGTH=662 /DNA_ID=CAMNT_0003611765 /DNA_START=70 /DNA_END=2059 /DNA_ORIENTATION=+